MIDEQETRTSASQAGQAGKEAPLSTEDVLRRLREEGRLIEGGPLSRSSGCAIIGYPGSPSGTEEAEYASHPARRIQQFTHYLKLMHDRTHEEAKGDCFIVFEDRSREPGRFVQFAFENHRFCMEVLTPSLSPQQAERILRERQGFSWVRDRPELASHQEGIKDLEPLWKVYAYGEEASAADDTAFVFFQVWGLPVGSRLHVCAAAFNREKAWEQWLPIT